MKTKSRQSTKSAKRLPKLRQAKAGTAKKVRRAKLADGKFCRSYFVSEAVLLPGITMTSNVFIPTLGVEQKRGKMRAQRIIADLAASTKKPRKTMRKGSPT